jgi:hypothetical protein
MLPASGLAILQERLRDVIPVARALLVRMRRAHAIAAIVEEAAGQEGGRASEPDLPGDGVGGEFFLHGLEQVAAKDRLMLAPMHLSSIGDLADVEPVLEEMGKRPHAKADTAALAAVAAAIDLGPDAPPVDEKRTVRASQGFVSDIRNCALITASNACSAPATMIKGVNQIGLIRPLLARLRG